jgi:hypothetical protein
MRMLIDLLSNDLGYARIFTEREGFGYELTTFRPRPMPDLFERMSGYASAESALEAAQQQLAAVSQVSHARAGSLGRRRSKARSTSKMARGENFVRIDANL